MPRKSYDQLNNDLSKCRRLVKKLSTDPDYSITTLAAAKYELAAMIDQGYNPAFITLVSFHPPTLERPPNSVGKIKQLCAHRDPNVVMRVRLSTHEILFFTEKDPSELMVSIQQSITKEEMQANVAFLPLSEDFESNARSLQSIVQAKRNGYQA